MSVNGRKFPEWAPSEMVAWLDKMEGKLPANLEALYIKLITDPRMKEVWEWFDDVRHDAIHRTGSNSISLSIQITRSLEMPGKPGDMPPKEREKYFIDIRRHARELIKLLEKTRFDDNYAGCEIERDKLVSTVLQDVKRFSDDDLGYIVAYKVEPEGIFKLPLHYPDSHLVEHLTDLLDWTYWDDCWDGSISQSSAPIAHSRSSSTRIIYFNCTLYSRLSRKGLPIPFPILATIANVALDLSPQELVDEEVVRKQVRRYQARVIKNSDGKEKADWEPFRIEGDKPGDPGF